MQSNYLSLVNNSKRIVFKVGSALLVDNGRIADSKINRLVKLFHQLREEGKEIILVSSGAVAAARFDLNKPKAKHTIVEKQALASIGQVSLMGHYQKLFGKKNIPVAQILLSKFSVHHRPSYINLQNTIRQLLKMGVLPIINENDPLATEEIKFGENDVLGALTSALVESDLYIILSNVDGFYFYHGQKRQEKLPWIESLEARHWEAAKKGKSSLGQGGMFSKLEAAKVADSFHIPTLITSGEISNLYPSIFKQHSGTLFFGQTKKSKTKITTHKKWLLSNVTPKGEIKIDPGAAKAIISGSSLLPKGVVSVKGDFKSGEVCNIVNELNEIIARGKSDFSSGEINQVKGKNLSELVGILGHSAEKEVIHRNHLIIL